MTFSFDEDALKPLLESCGWLPEDLLSLYREAETADENSPIRLMAVEEVIKINADLISTRTPQLGPVSWFWTDDNSNYCGIYIGGPLKG